MALGDDDITRLIKALEKLASDAYHHGSGSVNDYNKAYWDGVGNAYLEASELVRSFAHGD